MGDRRSMFPAGPEHGLQIGLIKTLSPLCYLARFPEHSPIDGRFATDISTGKVCLHVVRIGFRSCCSHPQNVGHSARTREASKGVYRMCHGHHTSPSNNYVGRNGRAYDRRSAVIEVRVIAILAKGRWRCLEAALDGMDGRYKKNYGNTRCKSFSVARIWSRHRRYSTFDGTPYGSHRNFPRRCMAKVAAWNTWTQKG
ncbi:hypothetical protein BD410DRAFT_468055 [Rickenella mellea]|uniref:Uncharacterized protein n=1 Tax=Rickenella mellea TaxID=50990 RepID=A0A4Y7PW82_9AGAM|nr:hypothetical protein BD410DRAFT_468055 [Rickenella mellea]